MRHWFISFVTMQIWIINTGADVACEFADMQASTDATEHDTITTYAPVGWGELASIWNEFLFMINVENETN